MSRILFDARPLAERSGVSRVTRRVLDYLHSSRSDGEIVCITTGWRKGSPSDIHLHIPNKLWSLACMLGLASLDRNGFNELILPNIGFVGTPKIPYTIVVHDLSFLIEPRWFSWRMRLWHRAVRARRLIQRATRVWCVSQTTAHDVERLLNVPSERIQVLPPDVVIGSSASISSDARRTTHDALPRPYVLAFHDGPRKNVSTVIATIAELRNDERYKDLHLVIIGSPIRHLTFDRSLLRHACRQAGAEPRGHADWIHFLPSVSDEALDDLYRSAKALLYPSWYEGYGLPVHEAVARGIPVLASSHGALPETAPPGTILIPPMKPHLWVGVLKETLS